jgi:hypothetical protein
MGALANAAILFKDETFRDWCMAAAGYQARQVILENPATENHQLRLDLAITVANDPLAFRIRFTSYLSMDPEVALKGSTAALVGEQTVLEKVASIWDTVSRLGVTQ